MGTGTGIGLQEFRIALIAIGAGWESIARIMRLWFAPWLVLYIKMYFYAMAMHVDLIARSVAANCG
jgi:hypothetical protein